MDFGRLTWSVKDSWFVKVPSQPTILPCCCCTAMTFYMCSVFLGTSAADRGCAKPQGCINTLYSKHVAGCQYTILIFLIDCTLHHFTHGLVGQADSITLVPFQDLKREEQTRQRTDQDLQQCYPHISQSERQSGR